jgi:hypothetical protein
MLIALEQYERMEAPTAGDGEKLIAAAADMAADDAKAQQRAAGDATASNPSPSSPT